MNDSKLKLYKCFKLVEHNFFDNFDTNIDKRIAFQKYGLFFAKIFGLQFGNFSLYLHGPYNSTLADIGYEINRLSEEEKIAINNDINNIEFNDVSMAIIQYLRDNLNIHNIRLLEVFSTYFYLINYRNITDEDARNKTESLKNELITTDNTIENTVNLYNNLKQFVNSQTNASVLV